jgi:predicted O-methyltransferase YrrM
MAKETLNDIGLRYGTDKASDKNNFLVFYEKFLETIRDKPVRVLEIGVLGGASVRLWRDYFQQGQIIGADINEDVKRYAGERLTIEIVDQSNSDDLDRVAKLGPFDLVVDDGSHVWEHQILTFQKLVPTLNPGGYYILEDLDTSYGKYIPDYKGSGGISAAAYLKDLSDWVVACRVLDLSKQPNKHIAKIWPIIDFIVFSRGTSLLKRKLSA